MIKFIILSLFLVSACNPNSSKNREYQAVAGDLEIIKFSPEPPRFIVEIKMPRATVICYIPALLYFNSFQHGSSLPLKAPFSGVVVTQEGEIKEIELRAINEENTILINCIPL